MNRSPRKRRGKENLKTAGNSNEKDHANKSNVTTKQKKRNLKAHGLASQDQIHRQRRNKMLIAVLIYIGIGAGVLLWKGLTKLPEIPPELESEILRSYPEHLKDIEMPKNIKKKTLEDQMSTEESEDHFQTTILNKLSLSSQSGSQGQKDKEWKEVTPQKNADKTKVRIFIMDEFVSSSDCEKLVDFHETRVKELIGFNPLICFNKEENLQELLKNDQIKGITSQDFLSGSNCLNESLSSAVATELSWTYSTAHYSMETEFLSWFEDALDRLAGLHKANGGKFQITSAEEGQNYDSRLQRESKHFATVFVYLHDVQEGGEINFSELGIKIKSKKGRAIVWNNMDPDGDWDLTSEHRILPIVKGKGHILQRSYYYQSSPALGKRPPPPDLPLRPHKSTPCVKCFDSLICHWYDEWS